MHHHLKQYIALLISAYLISSASTINFQEQQHDIEPHYQIEPTHYLDFPITKKDFQQWQTVGAAVILKNRAVIAPETRDKKGIMYSTQPNPLLKDWMLDVELNLGNEGNTNRGGAGIAIFYLKNVDQVSHKTSVFGYTSRFEGLGIYLNTLLKVEKTEEGSKQYMNAIQGFYNNGQKTINVFQDKKFQCYHRMRNLPAGQNFKIRIQYDSPLIKVDFFDIYTQTYEFCFSFEAPLDYNGYFLFSGASGVHNPDHVYLTSIKLYNPKVVSKNDHFQEARQAKYNFEEIQERVKERVKDIFEHKSQADSKKKNATSRDLKEFFELIPKMHHQNIQKFNKMLEQHGKQNDLFFETMKGLPQQATYNELNEKFFNFRLIVDALSSQIENETINLRNFEKQLKLVKHTANIQRGLQQREVSNKATQKLSSDVKEIDSKLQQINTMMNEFSQNVMKLDEKIKKEADFTQRVENDRRRFAQELSSEMNYNIGDIDDVFNQMELHVINSSGGWSTLMINIGMVFVILFSGFLWIKMNKYESRNA